MKDTKITEALLKDDVDLLDSEMKKGEYYNPYEFINPLVFEFINESIIKFGNFKVIKYLYENECINKDFIDNYKNLQIPYKDIKSIEGIDVFKNLKILNINYNYIESLHPVKNLVNLKELNCKSNFITSLEPLKKLTNLKALDVNHNNISSLKPLRNLKKLKILGCHTPSINIRDLETMKGIENLEHLEQLEFYYLNIITSKGRIRNIQRKILYKSRMDKFECLKNNK